MSSRGTVLFSPPADGALDARCACFEKSSFKSPLLPFSSLPRLASLVLRGLGLAPFLDSEFFLGLVPLPFLEAAP